MRSSASRLMGRCVGIVREEGDMMNSVRTKLDYISHYNGDQCHRERMKMMPMLIVSHLQINIPVSYTHLTLPTN